MHWGPSSISRHALGEFFSCVDCLLLLPSVIDQVVLVQVLQKFLLHQQRVWKMLPNLVVLPLLCVLEWWEVIRLQGLEHLSHSRSACPWSCPSLTRAGGFQGLPRAAGTSQRGLGQALLLWEQQDPGPGGLAQLRVTGTAAVLLQNCRKWV